MLRLQYNFRLRERIEAYEQARAPKLGNYCNLDSQAECCPLACSVSKNALYGNPWAIAGKKRSAWAQQDADLTNLRKDRPWYAEINRSVMNQMLRQLEAAFKGFFTQGRGYPKLKRRGRFRSFTYPPGLVGFQGSRIRLPGIGSMTFFLSRPFPDGFSIRCVTIRKKVDGWYTSVRLEDNTVPEPASPSAAQAAVGVDLGISKLIALSNGETVANPRFYKQKERRRQILARRASRKVLGSKKRAKAYQKIARLEHKIARQREDYQWKTAHKLVGRFDFIVFEDLNIIGMKKRCQPKQDDITSEYLHNGQSAKSALNQAISDAGWGKLKQKVKVLAARSGILVREVNPCKSSQECSVCHYVSPENRDGEKFICENCGYHADADVDAAIVILQRGLKDLGISFPKLPGVPRKVTPTETSTVLPVEPGNPRKNEEIQSKGSDCFLNVETQLFRVEESLSD